MQNLALSWQQAGALGAGLLAAGEGLRRTPWRRAAPFAGEAALISVLYALWQLAGSLSLHRSAGAFARASDIERVEHALGLPSEAWLQHLALPHPLLVQAANLYYATMHFAVMFAFLVWLFVRHRDRYARWRTTLAVLTAACLLVQLVPVAPPRLLDGYVDTAARYGQSVYTNFAVTGDQLSAMPSVHVAWALLVAVAVAAVSPSRWRWAVLAHPVLTVGFVVLTANHFWLDGIVAGALLVGAMSVQSLAARLRRPAAVPAAVASQACALSSTPGPETPTSSNS